MPLIYRSMKPDQDGYPLVERSASGLGVRLGVDLDVDQHGWVIVNARGMSVSPNRHSLPLFRIPKRLGGQGSDFLRCFCHGFGAFQAGEIATGLYFQPDSPQHGIVRPLARCPLVDFESALAATRTGWQVNET